MNYSGNMPDWHQYNPPPPQPNINEGTSSAQNVNSPHHYPFVSNVSSTSLNGHNLTAESLEKHQNDAAYNARHYQPHNNISNGQNATDNAILPSMVQMPGCVGHYGPPNARNPMGENINGPVDSRNVPIGTLNDDCGYRNNQLPLTGPIPHLNGPNININSAPGSIGPRNASGSNTVSTVRQGPPSYIPCKGLCCNPPDPNIGYQHWEKFGPYQHHTPYRDNARPTGYQTDNRRYGAEYNFRKDNFDGKDTMTPVVPSIDHRRNFPDYKYRKEPVIPRNYPPTSASLQNYSVQNYNYTAEYQKYSYPMKEYPKVNGMTMPNPGVLKHQEQNLVAQQKYNSKPLQYQNVGYLPKGTTSNVPANIISPTQGSYYNSQFPRTVQPAEFPRECQEQSDNSAAMSRMQAPSMQNAYSRYQAYQQKIMMQRVSMENHLREMTRIPGYQSHPKYKESVLRYRDILKAQQSITYQNPVQPNSQTSVPVNSAVPPINLQFDQNGTLINSSYLPEAFPRMQPVLNADASVESLHNQQKEHALNMSKVENQDLRSTQHLVNHSQNERPTPICPENLPTRDQFPVHKDLRQEQYKVQSNEISNYEALRANLADESAVHQKISKEFADKPELDVRQFLANWDETEDEDPSSTNLPAVVLTDSTPVVVVGYEDVGITAKSTAGTDNPKQKNACITELNVDGNRKEVSVLEAQDCLTISYPSSENIEISKFCSEESAVGSVVKPGSIIHCISNGPDEMPTIHIVDNVEIGNILKVSTETTSETFVRQNSLPLFEGTANVEASSEAVDHDATKKTQSRDSSSDYGTSMENLNNVAPSSSLPAKNNSPKTQVGGRSLNALSKNEVDPADVNLRKQGSFLCEESHNPDDISLPDLPTSECTPISTTLNTPVHSDNEESPDQVEDLTISTNPIEVVQNSPIISFTHSPVNVEPYEDLNGQRLNNKSHGPLEFDFPENEDKSDEPKDTTSEKDDGNGNVKSSKMYMLAKQNADSALAQNFKSSTISPNKNSKDTKSNVDSKTTGNKLESLAGTSNSNSPDLSITSAETVFRETESQEKLRPVPLQEDSLYNADELSERNLIDTTEMIPLIPGEESEEPRMPVPPMEGNCLTKVMKDTLPITNLNVIGSDDEKLDKEDDIWMQVGCMDRLMDCSMNLENSGSSAQDRNVDGSKFFKIRKKHFKHFKRIESNVQNPTLNNLKKREQKSLADGTTKITATKTDVERRVDVDNSESSKNNSEASDGKEPNKSSDSLSKTADSVDSSKERIKRLKEFRKLKNKSSSSDKISHEGTGDRVKGNSDAISDCLQVMQETQKICRGDSQSSFTKSFVTKNANPDFEIQVTNVNLKIKDKDIRTELRTLKDKNQIASCDSLDAIKIEINLSRGERNYTDKRLQQNLSEEVDLSMSNNKISYTSLENQTNQKKSRTDEIVVTDKLEDRQNIYHSTKSTTEDEKSKDRKIKINNSNVSEYASVSKKSNTEETNLKSLKCGKSLDHDSNNACSANKINHYNLASKKGITEDGRDSLSVTSDTYFENNMKDNDFPVLTDYTTKNSVQKGDSKENSPGKEDSLVISNEKFLFDAQKQSGNNSSEDVSVFNSTKFLAEKKISRTAQDVDHPILPSENDTVNSENPDSRTAEKIEGKRKSITSNSSDLLLANTIEETSKSLLDVSLPLTGICPDVSTENKASTLSNLSQDIKKLQDQFDSIEAAGKNFCMRDIKKLQEQLDSIEAAEKTFCGLESQGLYSIDPVSENPRRENTAELDFDNFDVAPNEVADSDDSEAQKWKKPRSNFRFEDCDLYESSSGFINPIFTSIDELENLNTVPVYTTKDGKITYSPNKKYTYRALIMEARERERYSATRDSYSARSSSHDYYSSSKFRRSLKKGHGLPESSRRRHMEYDSSRLSHDSTGRHFPETGDFRSHRSRSREDHVELFRNKDDPKFNARSSEDKCPEENRKYVNNFKHEDDKQNSRDKGKSHVQQFRNKFDGDGSKESMIVDPFLANRNICYNDDMELGRPYSSISERRSEVEKSNSDRLSSYIQKFGAPCESIKTWNVDDVLGVQKPGDFSLEKNKSSIDLSSKLVVKEPSSSSPEQNKIIDKRPQGSSRFSVVADSVNSNDVAGKEKKATEDEIILRSECPPKGSDLNVKSPLPEDHAWQTDSHSHANENVSTCSFKTISVPFDEVDGTGGNVIQLGSDLGNTISLETQRIESEKSINIDKRTDNETETLNNQVEVKDVKNLERAPEVGRNERDTAEQSECKCVNKIDSRSLSQKNSELELETTSKSTEINSTGSSSSKDIQPGEKNKCHYDQQTVSKQTSVLPKESPDTSVECPNNENKTANAGISFDSVPNCDVTEDHKKVDETDSKIKAHLDTNKLSENEQVSLNIQNININETVDDDLELPTLERIEPQQDYGKISGDSTELSNLEDEEPNKKSPKDSEDTTFIDEVPPVLQEEVPLPRIGESLETKTPQKDEEGEIANHTSSVSESEKYTCSKIDHSQHSSDKQIVKDTENRKCNSNSMETVEEHDSSAKNCAVVQTIPKLIIKKTESSLDSILDNSRTKLRLSLHPKIPKMIIRNVRSRPGTPTVEEIPEVIGGKTEQIVFKVDSKSYDESLKSEDSSQKPKSYDNKILKVKIKLDDSSSTKLSKSEGKEVWSSRKDSKKMVPKVTITKIKTSPKIQDNIDQSSREVGPVKADGTETNSNENFHFDRPDNYEVPAKIPKLKLRKQDSRSSSPDIGRKRQSSGSTEISSKKYRKSGREDSKQSGKRSNAENSEKKQALLCISEKIPKVIIKRTSASAEFKCELSKEGKDAIIKSAKWQPAVKLQRSEMLDRMVKDLKNSRVTLTQAILRAEEESYRFGKRRSTLSRSHSTSNLAPAKCKQRRMSDYDRKTNRSETNTPSFAKVWQQKDNTGNVRYTPKSSLEGTKYPSDKYQSKRLAESDSVDSSKRQRVHESQSDRIDKSVNDKKEREHVPKRRRSVVERQEEFNEDTQDACEIISASKGSQMEAVKSKFNSSSKVMCVIPEVNLANSGNFDGLKDTSLHFNIKQETDDTTESMFSFKDKDKVEAVEKPTENALTKDEVDCAFVKKERLLSVDAGNDCTTDRDDISRRAGGIASADSFEDTEASVIKVDSSDESQTTIEILPASPDVSQNDMELRTYRLNENVCERLYSEDAIPTQFELELEITDNSNVDPLDVPLPKETHFYRNEAARFEDDEDCFNEPKQSPVCADDKPRRRRSSRDERAVRVSFEKESGRSSTSFVAPHALETQKEGKDETRLGNPGFWCSDSLVKEVLAAKETLKKCLARSHGESKAGSKTKPKTAAEKKQGYSFSLDNLTDRFKGFAEFTKSGEDARVQEDLRVTTTNKQRKTDTESNTEKSDKRHSKQYTCSTMRKRMRLKLPETEERRSCPAELPVDTKKSSFLAVDARGSTTISLKNSKRLGHAALEDDAATSCQECEQTRNNSQVPSNQGDCARCSSRSGHDLKNQTRTPNKDPGSRSTKISNTREMTGPEEKAKEDNMPVLEPETAMNFDPSSDRDSSRSPPVITNLDSVDGGFGDSKNNQKVILADDKVEIGSKYADKDCGEMSVTDIVTQLAFHEKATINHRRYCILCERWFPTTARHRRHLTGYQHRHTELVQRRTIHALFMFFTGRPCPRLLPANVARTDCSPGEPTPLQIAVQDVATHVEQPQRDTRK